MKRAGPLAGVVFRNSIMNVVTQGLLMVLAFGCLPVLAHGLSKSDFGLLTLLWAVIGHFSLLDLGVSRAMTKFIAEATARGDNQEVRRTLWVSLAFTGLVGIVTCLLLIAATPWLVGNVFPIPEAERTAAQHAFYLASLGVPLTLVTGTIRGVQMAYQRFGLVNVTQALNAVIQWVGAALMLWMGSDLVGVIGATVAARVVTFIVAAASVPFLVPGVASNIQLWHGPTARRLLAFGGWVTVSQAINPLFQYLDRFLIGAFLSMTAVGFYSVPQEALTRLLVVPLSLTLTLFPALSFAMAGGPARTETLYERPLRLLIICMVPLTLILVVFAHDILFLWLGKEFADAGGLVFQIMSVGLFFNMVGQVPATALHAVGRPDLSAKFNLAELPVMIALNLALIPSFGIAGAAVTWSIRIIGDALLVFWAAHKLLRAESGAGRFSWVWRSLAAEGIVALLAMALPVLLPGVVPRGAIMGTVTVAFIGLTWMYWLDDQDKTWLLRLVKPGAAAPEQGRI